MLSFPTHGSVPCEIRTSFITPFTPHTTPLPSDTAPAKVPARLAASAVFPGSYDALFHLPTDVRGRACKPLRPHQHHSATSPTGGAGRGRPAGAGAGARGRAGRV